MEEVASFITFAQSEAIKRNNEVTVSWNSPGGHNANWCIGATLGEDVCVCTQTDPGKSDYCEIDDIPFLMSQSDFTDISAEFMHMNPNSGSFSFDPVRGVMTNTSSDEIFDNDYLFYVHSDFRSGGPREFELQLQVNITGRVSICTDDDRRRTIGGYPIC
jgi:Tfp pilus assembly protein FimT